MKNDIIGLSITTNIIFGGERDNLNDLLVDMENEIADLIERKWDVKVIGGTGKYITKNLDKICIEEE